MRNRCHVRAGVAAALLSIVLGACSQAPARPEEGGLDVTPKANKNYLVEGRVVSFVELEALVAAKPPTMIVLEQSRVRKGAACIVMLGLQTDIAVWTRTLNGHMHKVKADVKSSDVEHIEDCR